MVAPPEVRLSRLPSSHSARRAGVNAGNGPQQVSLIVAREWYYLGTKIR